MLAASSYVAWGLFPAYFLLLRSVSPVEALAHRMIWSLVFPVLRAGISPAMVVASAADPATETGRKFCGQRGPAVG